MNLKTFTESMHYEETMATLAKIGQFVAPPDLRERHPDFPWDDFPGLLDHHFNYDGLAISDALRLRQYHALYSKFEPLQLGIDKEAAAFQAFLGSEVQCKLTNDMFRARIAGDFFFPPAVEEYLLFAQRKIASILGTCPKLADLNLRYGPGATTLHKKRTASTANKLSNSRACSEPLVPYLTEVLYELPHLQGFSEECGLATVEIHNGKLSFVPKNAKTYRSTVTEPPLNGMCQLGIGDYMAKLLQRSGVDISDQSLNQALAREGSLTGELATLDLSSASDTISYELVRFLLPTDWFCFLKRFRSNKIDWKGDTLTLEKFSSMGNGFTFPLETLIFYALAKSCAPRSTKVNAYGDDIIVPTNAVSECVDLLTRCGFTINANKSYTRGPFRESCGADYLKGIDIRPVYVKDLMSVQTLFVLHNALYIEYPEIADYLLTLIPDHMKLYGPSGMGDGHLIAQQWGRPHNRNSGWGGYVFDTYVTSPKLDIKFRPGDAALPCYSIYVSGSHDSDLITGFTPGSPRTTAELRDYALGITYSSPMPKWHKRPCSTLPGGTCYKRISVYTLETPASI